MEVTTVNESSPTTDPDDALAALFSTPQITTGPDGVHRDADGHVYVAETVDGELTYRLDPLATVAGIARATLDCETADRQYALERILAIAVTAQVGGDRHV
jgi:streptogramin lyase